MRILKNWVKKLYLNWVYRFVDEDLCCCGEMISNSGCSFHCCRSAKEYAITSCVEK